MTASERLGPLRRLLHSRYLPSIVVVVNGGLTALMGALPFSDAGVRALDAILVIVVTGTGLLVARVIDTVVLAARRATVRDEEVPP